ncbi:10408_t:CDS:2 [Funneliformis caledonium]|uniref:10408_t:CDS:1 n=1 Tax=Funneliformis caledonium TaxID=1117310 RepID=A0A9N8V7Q8_9GLOM|nr:10408_t:CDS:2 [Funneliformis caledonium]
MELFFEKNNLGTVDEIIHLGHCVLREVWGGNFSSPIKPLLTSGAKVLDVGCGSGTWICEMSSDYPTSRYIGIDTLPLFPTTKPFNVQFIQHDFLSSLPFPDATFDFIHIRFMIFELTDTIWEQVMYSELVRVCKVGGWIEISDPELNLRHEGPITERTNNFFRRKLQSRGVNPEITSLHAHHLPSTPNISSNIYHEHREITISSRLSDDKVIQSFTTYMLESYRFILNSIGHELKLILNNSNGFRNGAVYGAKIRFPHALVMTFLFRTGSLKDKLYFIFDATKMHSANLAKFVTIYKTLMYLQRKMVGKEQNGHSFMAGLIGGYYVFGENNNVNQQIVLYVFARIMVGLAKLPVARRAMDEPKNTFPIFAAVVWGTVILRLLDYP